MQFTVLRRILTTNVMSKYGSGQQSYITSFLTAGTPEARNVTHEIDSSMHLVFVSFHIKIKRRNLNDGSVWGKLTKSQD